jgi:hypothetical protein
MDHISALVTVRHPPFQNTAATTALLFLATQFLHMRSSEARSNSPPVLRRLAKRFVNSLWKINEQIVVWGVSVVSRY